jgi:excisionase family DNA binding protein
MISTPIECDPALAALYEEWLAKTGEVTAAAMLVLAQVQASLGATPDCRPEEQPVGDYLTVRQAAKRYNLGERTIYRMVEDGLPVVRAGKAIRIKPRDLEKRLADSETVLR